MPSPQAAAMEEDVEIGTQPQSSLTTDDATFTGSPPTTSAKQTQRQTPTQLAQLLREAKLERPPSFLPYSSPGKLFKPLHLIQMYRLDQEATTYTHIHTLLHALPPGYPHAAITGIIPTYTKRDGLSLIGHFTSPLPDQSCQLLPGNEDIVIQRPSHFPTLDPLTRAATFSSKFAASTSTAVINRQRPAKTATPEATRAWHLPTSLAPWQQENEADTALVQLTRRLDQVQLAIDQLQTVQSDIQLMRTEHQLHQQQTRRDMAEISQQFMDYHQATSTVLNSLKKYIPKDNNDEQT
jgi:hypothetical protein